MGDENSAEEVGFQSTPPMQGATMPRFTWSAMTDAFQSTPPMQGATRERHREARRGDISIHAPHAGGDITAILSENRFKRFQSTPPMQGATSSRATWRCMGRFQSTPPMQGATQMLDAFSNLPPISIHAPHAGGDSTTALFPLMI